MTQYGNIKTISYDEAEILCAIIDLHNHGKAFDLDCTYSKGQFYASGKVPEPLYKSDVRADYGRGVDYARAEALPFHNKQLHSIIFDPPFLDGMTKGLKEQSKYQKRFGAFRRMSDLWAWYNVCMHEFYRVLDKGGILVVKCQDSTSQRAQYFSHCYIMNAANAAGFYAKDLFILLSKTRMRGGTWKKQDHARKYHCYFWVFSKQRIKVVNHFFNLKIQP